MKDIHANFEGFEDEIASCVSLGVNNLNAKDDIKKFVS